jgi:hypothetical protein
VAQFKPIKNLGIFIFIFTFTLATVTIFANCSFDFYAGAKEEDHHHEEGQEEKDQHSFFHCGVDLTNFAFLENFSLIGLTSCWDSFPQISKPLIPILTYPIFKIPKYT